MYQFKDFGISHERKGFTGDKIRIDRLLNRQITIKDYKIEPSSYTGKRLTLWIEIEGREHIVFTGSQILMEMIQKTDRAKYPFTTIIVKENEGLQFT